MNAIRKQLRATLTLIGAGIAFGAAPVCAIGLGDIRIHSYLNDPLSATVGVTTTSQEIVDVSCIRVIAPAGGGQAANGLYYLPQAQLELVSRRNDRELNITTREAVVEPIVGLVLQVDCPGTGRMVREYTLLLDPPLPETLRPAYARAPSRTARARRSQAADRTSAPDEWIVQRGETLSNIAASLIPGDRRAQFRLIGEIVEHNPDVFPDGDPNRLPAGARLRLPQHAERAVAGSGVSAAAPAVGARSRLDSESAPTETTSKPRSAREPRLTLSNRIQTETPEAAAETARMIADTRELILETEQQYANAEALKARMQRLEKQIVLLERTLASLDRITGSEVNIPAADPQAPPRSESGAEQATGERESVAMVAPQPAPQSAPPVELDPPTPVHGEAEAATSGYWGWLLLFLLMGGFVLWMRTRRAEPQMEQGASSGLALDDLVPEPEYATGGTMEAPAPELAHKAVVFSDDPLAGLPDESEAEVPEIGSEPVPEDSQQVPELDHELTQQIEDGMLLEEFDYQEREIDSSREVNNVLVRAEFHLLLKQVESAIKLLRDSIEGSDVMRAEPALWLMLLRIYREGGMREAFTESSQEFGHLFNIEVPLWSESRSDSVAGEHATLERDFPRLLHRIVSLWNTPNCRLFLDSLLLDDREGTRRGFDIDVAEELLLLKGVQQVRSSL